MEVTSATPSDGSVVQLPFTTLTVTFNEPYDAASVDPNDLILSQGTVTEVVKDETANSITYTLDGILQEGILTVIILDDAVTDIYGNPILPYTSNFELDFDVVSLPATMQSSAPLGSLIYKGAVSGFVSQGDIDSFIMKMDPGQIFTVVVDPNICLCPKVSLSGNGVLKTVAASSPGQNVVIQTETTINTTSVYMITVSGIDTSGDYTLTVLLNTAVEQESLDGPKNDDIASAQNLDTCFIDLYNTGMERGAVLGKINRQFYPFQIVDDFEDRNLDEYVSTTNMYDAFSVIEAAAHDGLYGLQANYSPWIYRNDPQVHLEQGNRVSVWVRSDGEPTGRAFFGFGASESGTLSVIMAPNTSQLVLFQCNLENSYKVLGAVSQKWLPNHWYRIDIIWEIGGDIMAYLYDSDGITLLNTVVGNDVTITSGGIAFRAFGSKKHFDTVEVSSVSNTDPDFYSFKLAANQTATMVLKTNRSKAALELQDAAGTNLASGTAIAVNADLVIKNFTAPASGTYYIQVTGGYGMEYNLLLIRDGAFDLERNDNVTSAQDLTAPTRGEYVLSLKTQISPQNDYKITASTGAHGSIDPNGILMKVYGSSQLFTATPDPGYEVDIWSVDEVAVQTSGETYTLSDITADHTVVVSFIRIDPGCAWGPMPVDGAKNVDPNVILGWLPGDYVQTVEGHLVYFGMDCNDVSDANIFFDVYKGAQSNTVYNPAGLAFDRTYYWRIDEVNGDGIWKGETWTFYTMQNPFPCPLGDLDGDCKVGYNDLMIFVDQWLNPSSGLDSADLNGVNGVNFEDFALLAKYWNIINEYTLTINKFGNGTITAEPAGPYRYGQKVILTAAPDTGYEVDTWSLDGLPVQTGGLTYTLTDITADHTVLVTFKVGTYQITASAGANGSIDPNGLVTKDYGSS
ncbi:MAG: Ig-like domain-containing protein, partial [Anaerohalosphaeraceae bacterium]